jgi:hypothetical protein
MATPLYIIPPVGSSGTYVFTAPFSTLALPDDEYSCRAVRKLSDYISNNEDAYTNVYVAAGLTQTDYQNDLSVDMSIASLQSQIGHWLYVPVRFIQSLPQSSGVAYQNKVLAVNIGAVPVALDLTFLTTAISNVVIDNFGITPQIQQVVTSKTSIVPYATDTQVQTARIGRITNSTTDTAALKALQIQYNNAITKIQALETYILNNKTVLGI